MSDITRTLFVDTNCLLHYPPVNQVDWCKIVDASKVKLVICLQVIHELDEKKSDLYLRERARRCIADIDHYRSGTLVRERVTLVIYSADVRVSDFPTTMNPDSGDDRILHLLKRYSMEHPEEPVGIVTEDMGMRLRCEAHAVPVYEMDEALRLALPQNAISKENQRLQSQLASLQRQLPDFKIVALGRGQKPPQTSGFEVVLSRRYQVLEESYIPKLAEECGKRAGEIMARPKAMGLVGHILGDPESERYARELMEFPERMRQYIGEYNSWAERNARSIDFNLWLGNVGGAPARAVEVALQFPDRFEGLMHVQRSPQKILRVTDEIVSFRKPRQPPEPTPPRSLRDLGTVLSRQETSRPPTPFTSTPSAPFVDVKREPTSYQVRVEAPYLRHLRWMNLGRFLARFRSWNDAKPFEAQSTVYAENHPKATRGVVLFKVGLLD